MQNRSFFSLLVDRGVFKQSDYNSSDLNHLGFVLNSYILKNYFRVNNSIQMEATSLLQKRHDQSLVGFHIRMGDQMSDVHEGASFLFPSDIPRFMSCYAINYTSNPTLFVASDSLYVKHMIKDKYPITLFQDVKVVHSYKDIKEGKSSSAVRQVLVDLIALSQCDIIIGTLGSSLTYLAGCLKGQYPLYVTRNRDCFLPLRLTTVIPR